MEVFNVDKPILVSKVELINYILNVNPSVRSLRFKLTFSVDNLNNLEVFIKSNYVKGVDFKLKDLGDSVVEVHFNPLEI